MNTEVMFSSKTDLFETPQDFFDELDQEFHFNLDVCALPENAKCEKFYTPEMDGLSQPWNGVCWCNPPYGREIGTWGSTVVAFVRRREYGRNAYPGKNRYTMVS